jgi:hypothetical protein
VVYLRSSKQNYVEKQAPIIAFGEKRRWVKFPRGHAAVKWSLLNLPLGIPGKAEQMMMLSQKNCLFFVPINLRAIEGYTDA